MRMIAHGDVARRFLDWVSDVENHTAMPEFSFVARECPGGYYMLVKGRLSLNRVVPLSCPEELRIENLRAGRFFIDPQDLERFCRELLTGVIKKNGMELRVVGPTTQGVEQITYTSQGPGSAFQANRVSVYQLIGHEHGLGLDPDTDWSLKSANPPYDSLLELASDYQLGPITAEATIEIAEFLVAAISDESAIEGNKATVVIGLVAGLERAEASIGFRVVTSGRTVRRRGVIPSSQISWKELEGRIEGTAEILVEQGDVVNCYASYKGRAQNQNWALDPNNTQNPLRSAYEAFDPALDKLTTWLRGEGLKKQNDFEFGVTILAWLLGFSPMHFEREVLTETPDILLWAANSVFVIECTVAGFGSEKVAKLVGRGDRIRQRLIASGHANITTRCVMVSCISGPDAEAPRHIALERGVLFADGNSISNLLQRTVFFPRPDALLKELLD